SEPTDDRVLVDGAGVHTEATQDPRRAARATGPVAPLDDARSVRVEVVARLAPARVSQPAVKATGAKPRRSAAPGPPRRATSGAAACGSSPLVSSPVKRPLSICALSAANRLTWCSSR